MEISLMSKETGQASTQSITINSKQHLFLKYALAVLVDLTILNLFNQYWEFVFIETFTVSLFVALFFQLLVQIALKVEQYAAVFLEIKMGLKRKIHRVISAWVILFISKLVILWVLNVSFGESVVLGGPLDGLVAFLLVVIAFIITGQMITWFYRSLSDPEIKKFQPN